MGIKPKAHVKSHGELTFTYDGSDVKVYVGGDDCEVLVHHARLILLQSSGMPSVRA